ncbi:Sensor histidine kinase RcsC [Dyadobacter sp. CECT 9275]|uniref:histidine kinase n=1 Tax=Dyadobacter helix TaxID=2822344 RepID=A0A916JJ22_9BACT|nr:ATP-binding protein [Dyadobacter sp. CECT 9275]CAG5018017.1 Sensor histidine kinase RcsC [Dyadobacter sp. CECT 9275]
MTQLRYSTLLLLLFVFRNLVFGQAGSDYEFISTAQGLSQGLINDMVQDREGFIWIATKGGLNRYDGYTFKTFTTDPQDSSSISSNSVSNLLEDSKGRLWIGTHDAGLNVYDKISGRFFRISHQPGSQSCLSGNRIVSSMIELPNNQILICPQGAPLNIVSLGSNLASKPFVTQLRLPGDREVLGVEKDDKGYIWVGCTDGSIYIYTPSSGSFEMLTDGHRFTGLIERVGTHISTRIYQLFISKPFPLNVIELQDSTGRMHPGIIRNGIDGNLLIANRFTFKTGAEGSTFYDFSFLKAGDPIDKAKGYFLTKAGRVLAIKCMLLDRSGMLWVGMLGYGLYKYRLGGNRFTTTLPKLSIQRITTLNNGKVYVQGWRSQTAVSSNGIACANPLGHLVSSNPPIILLQAIDDRDYWVYFPGQLKLKRYSEGLKLKASYQEPVNPTLTEQLQPLIQDSRRRIWLCGANGSLARIDPVTGRLSRFILNTQPRAGSATTIQTTAFYEDKSGVFWIGTEHGFARLTFKNDVTPPDVQWFKNEPGNARSLNYNYVSWFMDDPSDPDYLWISTKGGGVNRMQKSTGSFVHFTTRQGLPNDVVYGTLADTEGNIWGSTNRGLFCMLAKGRKSNGESVIKMFSTSDGLQADEFNTNAFAKLTTGDLVFGGVNGLNIFDPKKVLASSFTPHVYITGIQIGNKTLMPGDTTGVLRATIEQTKSITLSHLQDVVTLELSSLDFTAPQQNKYRYQLVGIDREWVESGNRRTATYLHLPAGNYVFMVQGSNSQGIWSDHIAELKIEVLPPWWRTWWAYGIYALLLILVFRTFLKFNINKAKLQSQLAFEQLEAKRVKELNTVKTRLYTNITHEFRTPLTVIMGIAQQVIEKPGEQFETRMDMIVRNGKSLLNLVNELLDLSKLETGKMQLHVSHGNVIHFLRYLVESFHSLAESQQKQLHFLTELDTLFIEYDQEKIKQIVSNLLSNAIKFTLAKGNIYISVAENTAFNDYSLLTIKVKDTGIGIPEDQLQFVFDRFYQLDNSHTRKMEGTGIGLALTKELVKLMKGEITVKSPPAGALKGSEFAVTLPVKKVYTASENSSANFETQSTSEVYPEPQLPLAETTKTSSTVPLILLVEDNADVVAYLASCLPNYQLAVGKDGREGYEIALEMIPDLIITDVMMPFMDGFELVQKLRQSESTSHIPMIMLTAKADVSSKIEGLQQGADAYLEKPFNAEELRVRIRKLLEMRKNLQQYYLRKAGLQNQTFPEIAGPEDKMGSQAMEDRFVKKVRESIEQNLTDADFTVEKLSKLVFMSHSQLHRKLDALTGCSPNRFIRMIRLEKAKALLRDPANSVASVAMDCGYEDPGYFARIFKQEFGVTPQKWRNATD